MMMKTDTRIFRRTKKNSTETSHKKIEIKKEQYGRCPQMKKKPNEGGENAVRDGEMDRLRDAEMERWVSDDAKV